MADGGEETDRLESVLFSALFFEKQKNRYSLAVFKDFLFRLGGSYLISGWLTLY